MKSIARSGNTGRIPGQFAKGLGLAKTAAVNCVVKTKCVWLSHNGDPSNRLLGTSWMIRRLGEDLRLLHL